MKTHFLLRFSLTFLALLSFSAQAAYPEGYPRIGLPFERLINEVPNESDYLLVPNTTANEFLLVWESPGNVLNALRLDGDSLRPVEDQAPYVLLDVRGENPRLPDYDFTALSSWDITWDSTRNRYFLAMYLASHRSSPQAYSRDTYAGFFLANENIDIIDFSTMPVCETAANSGGLRAIHRPGSAPGTGFIYVFRTFGRDRPPIAALLDNGNPPVPLSGICGQLISGRDGNAGAVFSGSPVTVAEMTDIVPDNNFTPFYMTDLAVEYDPAFNHFVLATTVAEGTVALDVDADKYYARQRSDIVGQIVGPGLQPYSGSPTSLQKISMQDHFSDTLIPPPLNSSPALWTAREPRLVMGPLAENGTSRNWLFTFVSYDHAEPNRQEMWSHRISVTDGDAIVPPGGGDRMLSHNDQPFWDTVHGSTSQGLWLPEVERFLNIWGACNSGCRLFTNSLKNVGGNHAAVRDLPLTDTAEFYRTVEVVKSLDGESVFVFSGMADRIRFQELDLAWMNLAASVEVASGTDITSGGETTVEATISRIGGVLDGPSDTHPATGTVSAATFASGAYRLHLTLPEHLELVQSDPLLTDGDLDIGFTGDSAQLTLNEGEEKTFQFTVRNDNPGNEAVEGEIRVAVESLGSAIEYEPGDDAATRMVNLLGVSDDEDGGDDDGNDDANPGNGDDGGDDGDDTDPGDGGDDGDDTGPGDDGSDDDDGDDTGSVPPGNDDDAGGSGGGGGGAFTWLLLGLAGFSVRRRLLN